MLTLPKSLGLVGSPASLKSLGYPLTLIKGVGRIVLLLIAFAAGAL
ncbi:hypothetical protein [Caulobacter phage Cr30]|nr:hypothetical protein OZ74_gp070 [Caulobacter phage Cr30]AGS80955.1 hypothetical protein [Caulobacter phage Cr30]